MGIAWWFPEPRPSWPVSQFLAGRLVSTAMSRNCECDVAFPTCTIYCSGCAEVHLYAFGRHFLLCFSFFPPPIFFFNVVSCFSYSFSVAFFSLFLSCSPYSSLFVFVTFLPSVILNCYLKRIQIALCVHYVACTCVCVCVRACVYVCVSHLSRFESVNGV
jgi:hypothetical protein